MPILLVGIINDKTTRKLTEHLTLIKACQFMVRAQSGAMIFKISVSNQVLIISVQFCGTSVLFKSV